MIFLLFGIFVLIMISIPIGIAYLIYRFLSRKGYKKSGLLVLFSTIALMVYLGYTSIYPEDSFYKDEFEYNAGIDFPKSGKIIWKEADYPDIHGDYEASMIFTADSVDFENMLNQTENLSGIAPDSIDFSLNINGVDFTDENGSHKFSGD